MKSVYSVLVEQLEGLRWRTVQNIVLDECKTKEEAIERRNQIREQLKANTNQGIMRTVFVENKYDEEYFQNHINACNFIMGFDTTSLMTQKVNRNI